MAFSHKLTIDTPEQISIEYEIAGLGSRFMVLFVDLSIQGLAAIVLTIVLAISGVSITGLLRRGNANWTVATAIILVFLVQWGYFAIFEIVWKGQTPGKRNAGIRVINESGREASIYEAVARNLLRVIDSLPGAYAVGAVVIFLSPSNKRLGDYVAGTIVVHDHKPEKDTLFFNTDDRDIVATINYKALNAQDLQVIETFLQRRLDLQTEVRQRTAAKLASHFRQVCSAAETEHPDDENFLEVLVRGFRQSARFHG